MSLAVASLAASAPAAVAQDVPNLTPTPEAPEPEPAPEPAPSGGQGDRPSSRASELPETGADPRLLALAGAALLLTGAGLRMRTLDERF